jgi:hypothetical protein
MKCRKGPASAVWYIGNIFTRYGDIVVAAEGVRVTSVDDGVLRVERESEWNIFTNLVLDTTEGFALANADSDTVRDVKQSANILSLFKQSHDVHFFADFLCESFAQSFFLCLKYRLNFSWRKKIGANALIECW